MKRIRLWLFALFLSLLVACQQSIPDAKNWPIEDFTFIDQNGQQFGLADLKGKVWVADFIFTRCADVCPPMTANMAKLQKMVKEKGLDVHFVSFSVDPENDTPDALKAYVEKFQGDMSRWHLLTGYTQQEIERFAQKNFKAVVKKPQEGDQVIHGTDFYLVDQNGKIVKYYSGLNDVPYEEILKHIDMLQE